MRPEIDNKKCEFGSEIPGYLYNEMAEKARLTFEFHLADCQSCIDEFAELSDARFSVLEWQKTEFADLPTPSIVIPYDMAPSPVAASAGWIGAFLDLVRVPVFGYAAGFAALLLVLGTVAYFTSGGPNNQVAEVRSPAVEAVPLASLPVVETGNPEETFPKATPLRKDSVTSIKPVNAKVVTRAVPRQRPLTALMTKPRDEKIPALDQAVRKPALSTFDDDDDSSLRLADLFDDGGV